MSKELPFFKFYTAEWLQGDITLEDYDKQGLFINICAYYWAKKCRLEKEVLFKKFKGSLSDVEALLKGGLIKANATYIKINFLDEQFLELTSTKSKLSDAGKKGAEERERRKKEARLKGGLSNKEVEIEVEIEVERDINVLNAFKENVINEAKVLSYDKSIFIPFLEHWTERDFESKCYAWQVPETFIIKSRLKGWVKNENKYNKSSKKNGFQFPESWKIKQLSQTEYQEFKKEAKLNGWIIRNIQTTGQTSFEKDGKQIIL